ncbi:MAG: hypothetical protein ACTSPY_07695 [Candidatus Helarchaeota archaeon]
MHKIVEGSITRIRISSKNIEKKCNKIFNFVKMRQMKKYKKYSKLRRTVPEYNMKKIKDFNRKKC